MDLSEILIRKEPITYLLTTEESRSESELQRCCQAANPARPLYRWSFARGMEKWAGGVLEQVRVPNDPDARVHAATPLVAILRYIVEQCPDDAVFLLKDVHQFFKSSGNFHPATALTCRAFRDAAQDLHASGKQRKIVLVAPELVIPTDLEKDLHIVDLPLPTREDLAQTMQGAIRKAQAIHQKDKTFRMEISDPPAAMAALVDASLGLTKIEVENLLGNLLYVDRALTDEAPRRIVREKQQIIRKSGVLEFIPSEETRNLEVGGLEALLHWLRLRKRVFERQELAAKEYGIRQLPRGVLLAGISGCGKSLVCKKIADEWGMPLLRLDIGAIFDRFVGASEERMRRALNVAESIAPCILWIDEIEKGFGGGLGGGDSGTSGRVLGTFLVWMQEKKAPVFIAATANDITALPPELLRPGRFDNRFFVGCPGDQARRDIFTIHLRSRRLDPGKFDLNRLVDLSFGYTGAEIEQVVLDSAYDAFFEERRADMKDLTRNIARTRPMVKSLGRQMQAILQMLHEGRMELASEKTLHVKELVDRLEIDLTR